MDIRPKGSFMKIVGYLPVLIGVAATAVECYPHGATSGAEWREAIANTFTVEIVALWYLMVR